MSARLGRRSSRGVQKVPPGSPMAGAGRCTADDLTRPQRAHFQADSLRRQNIALDILSNDSNIPRGAEFKRLELAPHQHKRPSISLDSVNVEIDKSGCRAPLKASKILESYRQPFPSVQRKWIEVFAGAKAAEEHVEHIDDHIRPVRHVNEAFAPQPTTSYNLLEPAASAVRALFSASPLPREKEQDPSRDYSGEINDPTSEEDLPTWARHGQEWEAPKLPIVFAHGLFGFDIIGPEGIPALQVSYWRGVRSALEDIGCEVFVTQVPASASIEERARALAEAIGQGLPGRQINLVGHSMGGLDSRFLVSKLKPTNFTVRSITTIATPHRGSPFADYLLDQIIGHEYMPRLLQVCDTIGLPGGGKGFRDLTTSSMARFNRETPDVETVAYHSYTASFMPEGQNDGLVSVASAKWGEVLGDLTDVDHLSLVGWQFRFKYAWADVLGRKTKYRANTFYLSLATALAQRGF